MEFRSRSNQPQPARPAAAAAAARPSYEESNGNNVPQRGSEPHSKKNKLITLGVVVVVLILLGFGAMFVKQKMMGAEKEIKGDKFQALFLTNGQVYFGHLSQIDSGYAKMSDIYYLQVQQAVQPADNKDKKDEQPQVSLTKLGNELHGPEDSMHISRDQILFWENLKDDSKVVQAIKEHQKK